jgi:serine/threonine protein kinase
MDALKKVQSHDSSGKGVPFSEIQTSSDHDMCKDVSTVTGANTSAHHPGATFALDSLYQVLETIGSGSFGIVMRARRRQDHVEVAIKIMKKDFVDRWIDADSGKTIEVTDPATGRVIGAVPDLGRAETARAIAASAEAFKDWSRRPARDRAGCAPPG